MKFHRYFLAASMLALSALDVYAATATQNQAAKIAAGIEGYIGAKPGLVTVKPNGDVYDVTLDFNVYKSVAASSGVSFELSPQMYKVTDAGGGKWKVESNQPINAKFKVADAAQPQMPNIDAKVTGRWKSVSTYDEGSGIFTETSADLSDLVVDETLLDPSGQSTVIKYTAKAMHQETKAVRQGSAVDISLSAALDELFEEVSLPAADGRPGFGFKLLAARGTQSVDVKGMKLDAMKAMVRFVISHANDDPNMKKNLAEFRKLAADALPLFDRLVADGSLKQLSVESSGVKVGAESVSVNIGMNGLVANGEFGEGLVVEGLTLPPGLVPPFAQDLLPSKFALDFNVSDFNLAEAAKIFVEEFDPEKQNNPELDAKLAAAVLPSGQLTFSTDATMVTGKDYEFSMSGKMKAGPTGTPSGIGVVKARGLDAVVKSLQAAPPEAGTAQAVAGILVAKGFGKVEGDTVTWNIEAQPGGAVLINGVDVSKLAGSPPAQ